MVTIKGSSVPGSPWEVYCESTDEKPIIVNGKDKIPTNSLCLELDTGVFCYFDGSSWQDVGGNA